jgi:hypothetical protein
MNIYVFSSAPNALASIQLDMVDDGRREFHAELVSHFGLLLLIKKLLINSNQFLG